MFEDDTIVLEGLRVECIIGDLPHERLYPQELFLDLEIVCEPFVAAQTDKLADTVDYVAVIADIRKALERTRCQMLERAAQVTADTVLGHDSRIRSVLVKLRKPHALPGVVAGVRVFRAAARKGFE